MSTSMGVDRDIETWLSDGPTTAPQGLLESSLAGAVRESQRPRWLAEALGAPTFSRGAAIPRLAPRLAILLALLLAATITAILVGPGLRDREDLLTVVPSGSVAPEPSQSARPTATPPVTPGPVVYTDRDATFSVDAQRAGQWASMARSAPNTLGVSTTVFRYDDCPDGTTLCLTNTVSVNVAHLGDTLSIHLRTGTDSPIEAAALDVFAASWQALVGPSSTAPTVISDWAAISMTATDPPNPFGGGPAAVYIVETNKVVFVQVGGVAGGRIRLNTFLSGFRLLNEAPIVYRSDDLGFEVTGLGPGRWSHAMEGGFGAGPGEPGMKSVSFWFGDCVDNICPGYVTATAGTVAEGTVVALVMDEGASDFRAIRVTGRTLDELESSWTSAFGSGSFERRTVDGIESLLARSPNRVESPGATAMLTVVNDRVLAFIAHPPAFASRIDENRMLGFVTRVTLLP